MGGNVSGESVEASNFVPVCHAGLSIIAGECAHCADMNVAAGDGQVAVREGGDPVVVWGHTTALELILDVIPEFRGRIWIDTVILVQRVSQRSFDQIGGVIAQHIATDASSQLQDEDDGQHDREAEHQAIVLLQGTPATKERDYDDERSYHDQERGDREELSGQEELIARIDGANSGSHGNQDNASDLDG